MITEKNVLFCESTCRTASSLGFGLMESDADGQHWCHWRSPHGEIIDAPVKPSRAEALLAACRTLATRLAGL